MKLTCGVDWAEAHHDMALVDEGGAVVARARIDTGATGFSALLTVIAEHGGRSRAAPSVAGEHWLKPPSDGQPHHCGGIGVGQHVNPAPSDSLRVHKARQFQFA